MSDPVIKARGLTKRYAQYTAVDGIDLTIERGEIFGILGPNGAGKTTTILMLLGLTDVTEGTVEVVGLDPARDPLGVKRVVAYMPDTVGFYPSLTARENLVYSGRLAGIPAAELNDRIAAALERVRLTHVADRREGAFSRGMRQRLGLAEVIMKQPHVAILDEPTSGLDPQSSHEFLDMIRALRHDGMTILLSSHLLDRVQAVCDRVALFRDGRIELEGSVATLARQVLGGGYRIELQARGDRHREKLAAIEGVVCITDLGEGRLFIEADRDVRDAIVSLVIRSGSDLLGLSVHEPNLDEIYNAYFQETKHAA